jgi:hypothetical protein
MRVENMTGKNGRAIPNQFILFTPEATFFQSYNSIIVKTTFEDGRKVIYFDETYWDYSNTTRKYRNQFLGETSAETKQKIKSGEYKLVNLNQ